MREVVRAAGKCTWHDDEVSMPSARVRRIHHRIASIPAFAANMAEIRRVPPAELLLDTQTNNPRPCLRNCGSAARLTRWVDSTLNS